MGNAWIERLDREDVLLIDSGMGTELQRRGVPMDLELWNGRGTHRGTARCFSSMSLNTMQAAYFVSGLCQAALTVLGSPPYHVGMM